jgi:hypothetical protein
MIGGAFLSFRIGEDVPGICEGAYRTPRVTFRTPPYLGDRLNDIVTVGAGTWERFLSEIPLKSGLRTELREHYRGLRRLFPWMLLLSLFGLASSGTATAAETRSGPVTSLGPGPQFAIADFDGDLRPDLVSIQAGANMSGGTNYWIQLQLTSAGRQLIQLVAPPGGLLIEARDVNGDHTVDLVLATAWFRQPVAIFLNDGHGSFSRAEATAFPGAFSNSTTNWDSGANLSIDAVGVPPQSGASLYAEERSLLNYGSPASLIPPSSAGYPAPPFLISQPGRAPPSEVPRS